MLDLTQPYIDHNGKHWKTYQDYCNSDDLPFDTICVLLNAHKRIPQNDEELALQKSCDKDRAEGKQFEFAPD